MTNINNKQQTTFINRCVEDPYTSSPRCIRTRTSHSKERENKQSPSPVGEKVREAGMRGKGFTSARHPELVSGSRRFSNGFTLIELLVVVLIIAILAAVALPQYQKAVEKSRASAMFSFLKAIGKAQETYYLENGEYATAFSNLNIPLSADWEPNCTSGNYTVDCHSNGEWKIEISTENSLKGAIYLFFNQGKYLWAGFYYLPSNGKTYANAGRYTQALGIGCVEKVSSTRTRGDYCTKLWSMSYIAGGSGLSFFQ